MSGQFLCNAPIHVSYAYKEGSKGERHGSYEGKNKNCFSLLTLFLGQEKQEQVFIYFYPFFFFENVKCQDG
jgi:hypothetical protein